MNTIVHFEIHVDDVQRATKFYTEVFGWQFPEWMPGEYWGVMTAPGAGADSSMNGGMLKRKGGSPNGGQSINAFVCTVQVEDIDTAIQKVEAAGGTVTVPKHPIQNVAWQAYCKDTEGNLFGIHQADTNAK